MLSMWGQVLEGHGEAVLALAVGDNFLVSGSYDATVRFWSLDSLRCVRWAHFEQKTKKQSDALAMTQTLMRKAGRSSLCGCTARGR